MQSTCPFGSIDPDEAEGIRTPDHGERGLDMAVSSWGITQTADEICCSVCVDAGNTGSAACIARNMRVPEVCVSEKPN